MMRRARYSLLEVLTVSSMFMILATIAVTLYSRCLLMNRGYMDAAWNNQRIHRVRQLWQGVVQRTTVADWQLDANGTYPGAVTFRFDGDDLLLTGTDQATHRVHLPPNTAASWAIESGDPGHVGEPDASATVAAAMPSTVPPNVVLYLTCTNSFGSYRRQDVFRIVATPRLTPEAAP